MESITAKYNNTIQRLLALSEPVEKSKFNVLSI